MAFLFLFSSCQEDNILNADISRAKACFEQNAENLSLPIFGKANDKLKDMASAVHPVWKDAILSRDGESTLIETPLAGTCRIGAAIVKIYDHHTHIEQATTKSYLIIRIEGKSLPAMSVETFIQEGKECTMTALSDRTNIIGFEVVSNLDGTILSNLGIHNGQVSFTDEKADFTKIDRMKGDFVGYRAGYVIVTKDHVGCPEYAWVFCDFCQTSSYINLSDMYPCCPTCGASYHNGNFYCANCGATYGSCTCATGQGCGPCGRNKLNCDGCSETSIYCECD